MCHRHIVVLKSSFPNTTAVYGSVEIQWGYAYSFAMRNRKNFLSATPLRFALNNLILALNDSAIAFEERWLQKFSISSQCSQKVAAMTLNECIPASSTLLYHYAVVAIKELITSLLMKTFQYQHHNHQCSHSNLAATRS